MNFTIIDKKFNYDIKEINCIKSYNKTYSIEYTKKNIQELIKEIYVDFDFILIDKNLITFDVEMIIKNKQHLLFNATEENKSMNMVLEIIDKLLEINFTKKK